MSQVLKDDVKRIAKVIRDQTAQTHQPCAATRSAQSGSAADEHQKLAQLRDQGVLSQDEFAAQKLKLIG